MSYGLLANGHKAERPGLCRTLFNMPPPQPAVLESVADFMARVAQANLTRCSKCENGRLRLVAALAPLRRAYTSQLATGPPA